jgi:futalosine hydrolase
MKITVVAATTMELEFLREHDYECHHQLQFEVHGVGLMNTVYHLTKLCRHHPAMLIQCGIAGTFNDNASIGEAVAVYSDTLGDTGAEDHADFLDLFDLGLDNPNNFPFKEGKLVNAMRDQVNHLKWVNALTVNTTSGSIDTIARREEKYRCDIETMEGAALHYVCLKEGIPFLQLRGISNKVEPRDKSSWNIPAAMTACRTLLETHLQELKP